ncbi:hypothetical protein J1N35_043537, partial [Gossypium stocksii]
METKDRHVPSPLRQVYNYTRGRQFTTQSISRLGCCYEAILPLIVFAMVEKYESDRVMRQFECTQHILPQPQGLDDLYKIDMRGKLDKYWATFYNKYIEIWQH